MHRMVRGVTPLGVVGTGVVCVGRCPLPPVCQAKPDLLVATRHLGFPRLLIKQPLGSVDSLETSFQNGHWLFVKGAIPARSKEEFLRTCSARF